MDDGGEHSTGKPMVRHAGMMVASAEMVTASVMVAVEVAGTVARTKKQLLNCN